MSATSTAKANDNGKTNGIDSDKTAKVNGKKTATEQKEGETPNMESETSTKLAVAGKNQESAAITTRPISATGLVVRETINSSGIRPIVASDLKIAEMINSSGMRPVGISDFQVAEMMNSSGMRPIGVSTLKVAEMMNSSGMRPIMASNLHISETVVFSGNRPVADNEDQDAGNLMGYLD
ncbi:hypothetical protein ACE1CI_00995 [Aerosakkonemataceae cyanobacterium BLCC-F50]|uniref:CBS domain-containing protein n=1 Tax=Floridaenema flaviceps BLCC-F50 TaxID=3153642 RepID=A0ABV4XKL2_9CYAN